MELSKLVAAEEDEVEGANDNFWSQIMAECQANCHNNKLPASKSLLVLGEDDAQKAQLVAKLQQGSGEGKLRNKGNGLQYHFLTVRDEYCEHQTRLDVWVLDEDPAFKDLLKFALNERTLPDTTVLLTASMARPWDILRCVELWSRILDEHIRGCGVEGGVLQERRASVLKRYREYVEPTASIYGPLDDGVINSDQIEHNLGVEIIVVITQTEHMTALQSEYGFIEEHFDFIQFSLRRFCMSRGAALLYVSAKEDRNCDVLLKYVLHKIYALPFRIPAMFLEKDSIFVPAGWDSESKVLALAESSLATIAAGQPYEEVIAKPGRLADGKKPAVEVEAQRDQDFLAAIQPAVMRPLPENHNNNGTNGADVSGVVSSSRNPSRRVPRTPRSPQKKQQLESKLAGGVEGDTVLQSFFKSLLKRQTSAPAERPRNHAAAPPEEEQDQKPPTLGSRRLGASVDSPSLPEADDELNNPARQQPPQDPFTEFMSKYRSQQQQQDDPLEDDVNPLPEYFLSSGGGGHCCAPNGNSSNDPLEDTLDRVKSKYNPPLRLLLMETEKQAFQNDIRQSSLKVNCVAVASSDGGEKADDKSAADPSTLQTQAEKADDQ